MLSRMAQAARPGLNEPLGRVQGAEVCHERPSKPLGVSLGQSAQPLQLFRAGFAEGRRPDVARDFLGCGVVLLEEARDVGIVAQKGEFALLAGRENRLLDGVAELFGVGEGTALPRPFQGPRLRVEKR